jgi:hypothetical protein
MSRKRGRIVLVGVTGLELSRADFYEKELTFQVSCSYGPGRYDPNYEEKGQDYPVGFVRWTAQRNFEAVLDMMADGRLEILPLVSHCYALITGEEPSLGVLIEYAGPEEKPDTALRARSATLATHADAGGRATIGFIGAGDYATSVLIPAFRRTGARLKTVASMGGVSGIHAARKFGFEEATTDVDAVLGDREVAAVVIATRHDSHGDLVCHALRAGKHVLVEKPLAIDREGLARIESSCTELAAAGGMPLLMVGFNRRFAPHVQRIKSLVSTVLAPKAFVMTVNAGAIPRVTSSICCAFSPAHRSRGATRRAWATPKTARRSRFRLPMARLGRCITWRTATGRFPRSGSKCSPRGASFSLTTSGASRATAGLRFPR